MQIYPLKLDREVWQATVRSAKSRTLTSELNNNKVALAVLATAFQLREHCNAMIKMKTIIY